MATSTRSQRAQSDTIAAGGDVPGAGPVRPLDQTLARAEERHSAADERDQALIVLPDVVELAWEPYYLEPPD